VRQLSTLRAVFAVEVQEQIVWKAMRARFLVNSSKSRLSRVS
jgi:hypothetical protein